MVFSDGEQDTASNTPSGEAGFGLALDENDAGEMTQIKPASVGANGRSSISFGPALKT
jgi:hypothetical protein